MLAAQATTDRLIATLEAFLRHASPTGRVVEFDHLLMWILDAARRGERADRIARRNKAAPDEVDSVDRRRACNAHRLCPTPPGARDSSASISEASERSRRPTDVLLRTAAQLLSIVSNNGDRPLRATPPLDFKTRQSTESPVIAYSVTDWLTMRETDGVMPQLDPWLRTA